MTERSEEFVQRLSLSDQRIHLMRLEQGSPAEARNAALSIAAGDIVGISVHTGNALRGYEVGRMARARGAWVVYGGIHATLFPEEPFERGEAHCVVKGDGDLAWAKAVVDCMQGKLERVYDGGRIGGSEFLAAR